MLDLHSNPSFIQACCNYPHRLLWPVHLQQWEWFPQELCCPGSVIPPRTYSRLPWHSCPYWAQKFSLLPGQCPWHAGAPQSQTHWGRCTSVPAVPVSLSSSPLVCSNAVEILRLHQNASDFFRHQKHPILCGGVTLASERLFSLILKVLAASLGNFWWCFTTFTVKIFFLISCPNVALSDFLWESPYPPGVFVSCLGDYLSTNHF